MKKCITGAIISLLCLGVLVGCTSQRSDTHNASTTFSVWDTSKSVSPSVTKKHTAAYDKLISYKVDDLASKSINEFNRSLTPKNGDLSEILDTHATSLTSLSKDDENYVFITTTLTASLNELYCQQLGEEITFSGYVNKVARPIEAEKELPYTEPSYQFHFTAFYNLHYTIEDINTLTVGDRDYALKAFNTEFQSNVELLNETELTSSDIRITISKIVDEIANSLSSEKFKLTCEISSIEVHNNGSDSQK